MCKDIDERVNAFLGRLIDGEVAVSVARRYLPEGARGGRSVSVAAIIAIAVNTKGQREIIGLGIGPSEADQVGNSRNDMYLVSEGAAPARKGQGGRAFG